MNKWSLKSLTFFLTLSLTLLLSADLVKSQQRRRQRPVVQTSASQAAMTGEQALDLLKAGNRRFVTGRMVNRDLREQVRATSGGQFPYAVTLTCQDSRTAPEVLFDLNKGDSFSIRIAGNIVNDDILGGMEFGNKVSRARLLAVIGHTDCGAIKGIIDNAQVRHLGGLLNRIKPAIDAVPANVQPRDSKNKKFVDMVAKENVLLVIKQIRDESPELREMADAGQLKIVGGMYDLETGRVTFFEDK